MSIHAPIYHEDADNLRVACRSNGLWQAQRLSAEEGTQTNDPWKGLQTWTTKPLALAKMNSEAAKEAKAPK